MLGLAFETQPPVVVSDPNRSDIACFVGYVARRPTPLPRHIAAWLGERGWDRVEHGRLPLQPLLDVPVPIDNWETFDALFAWERRAFDGAGLVGSTYLGAAVRSFFAHGGRKCYVVRAGDPWPAPQALQAESAEEQAAREAQAAERIAAIMPDLAGVDPVAQESWRGAAHLLGLDDVSFLCLPDLPDIVGVPARPQPVGPEPPAPPEQFVACADSSAVLAVGDDEAARYRAPRTDEAGYAAWANALQQVAALLARHRREVQLVAAIPLPQPGTAAEAHLLAFLVDGGDGPLAQPLEAGGLSSAFVQLSYPWLRTRGSNRLPQQLEPPDAILTGLLAQNALARGTYRSAANLPVDGLFAAEPALDWQQLYQPVAVEGRERSLQQRVSLLGQTPTGWRLLSDVSTSLNEAYRPASSNRLLNVILRSARLLGETMVFAASNEALWAMVREALTQLLTGLYQAGALRGPSASAAFQVRCDRDTMTQEDIDNGRVIAAIQFDAAAAIEQITVVLAMDEGGQVSLVPA